ncbi:MAG: DNA mismatch repair endonuclease MutL [Bacteroidales bacterium]|nr:DNA mismatch repair endonuclease MutL [Bacteroidales bacterium]
MADLIRLLPDSVANQIAAGEVIQRPASAVKELLENAVDAGAGEIKLFIKDAGKTLIQVIDDGCGMSETDARMSFERHATSKIQTADDLFAIRTMGFRGEALASVAAIAQVELKSKRLQDELGTQLEIEGARVVRQIPCNCPDGTSIAVKNLFFNVPARRNFLKSNNAETRHIIEEFQRVALANPGISFSMFHNGRPVFQLKTSNLKQRVVGLFGKNYNEKLVPLEQSMDKIRIRGFIGKPQYAKKSRGEQYFFVNNRFIKHPYLHHSVDSAFEELLPEDAYPSYFIFFDVDPKTIDVNIHPTKTEVNFQDQQLMYSVLRSAIRESLGKYNITPTLNFDAETSFDVPPPKKGDPIKQPTVKINPDYNPFRSTGMKPSKDFSSQQSKMDDSWKKLFDQRHEKEQNLNLHNEIYIKDDEKVDADASQLIESDWSTGNIPTEKRNIFQLQLTYILANIKSGLMIIHQQYAHERILYEHFLATLSTRKQVSQQQLFPVAVTFSAADVEIIEEIMPELKMLGFDISNLGNNSYAINGTPADLPNENVNELLEKVVENYKKNLTDLNIDKKINLAHSMARNIAIKPGTRLEVEEMEDMIDKLFACEVPQTSPSGKPTISTISLDEMEKRFK